MEQRGVIGERIAFFGGSFDPPHFGHLAVARAARASLGVNMVLFAPVGAQPLKPKGSMASFADRMAMTELAIEGEPGFAASPIDAPKADGTANFTFDTLTRLRSELAEGSILYCLMGADSFLSLRKWHRAAEIPFLAPLIVGSRPRESMNDVRAALPEGLTVEVCAGNAPENREIPDQEMEMREFAVGNEAGQTSAFFLLPGLHEDISASQIREAVRGLYDANDQLGSLPRRAADGFLPSAVLAYIREHGLYR
jgi:nicotinate-nucleotide adenylyltransferase